MRILSITIVLLFFNIIQAQSDSTSKRYSKINWTEFNNRGNQPKLWKKIIVPIGLAGISLSLNNITTKTNLQNQLLKPFNGFHTELDDYIQYAPVGIMYTADLFKFKAQNSVWNQTKYLAISEFFTAGIVHILKNTLKIQRPNNGAFNAFPSGHTSQAFVESQVLFNEFYQSNKVIALSGFLFSVSTGSLRVINNRHWVPDVLMGASIAIVITNLVYHFKPLKNWNPWKKKSTTIGFYPAIGEDYIGGNFKLKF